MLKKEIEKFYIDRYYKQAEDPNSWFGSGIMNQEIAEFLLKKYNSSHKRLLLQSTETVLNFDKVNIRRINPYHLQLHKYILMFFGLSLECLLKGFLIKIKKVTPLKNTKGNFSLSKEIKTHALKSMYLSAFEKYDPGEEDTLERLERAVLAGKYPLESNIQHISSYTGYFDTDIKKSKLMIKKMKNVCFPKS